VGRLAEVWRGRHGQPGDRYRFDVITVADGGAAGVVHIPDAWRGIR
jgi:hypothetical protein